MPYYNGYNPMPYANPYSPQMGYSPQAPTFTPPHSGGDTINWVLGEAGAKAYMVAPGATVLLMDRDQPVLYIKTVDASGMPSLRIFDYVERNASRIPQNAQEPEPDKYITRAEFEEFVLGLKSQGKHEGGAVNA